MTGGGNEKFEGPILIGRGEKEEKEGKKKERRGDPEGREKKEKGKGIFQKWLQRRLAHAMSR